jgi:hypothetical protein
MGLMGEGFFQWDLKALSRAVARNVLQKTPEAFGRFLDFVLRDS